MHSCTASTATQKDIKIKQKKLKFGGAMCITEKPYLFTNIINSAHSILRGCLSQQNFNTLCSEHLFILIFRFRFS